MESYVIDGKLIFKNPHTGEVIWKWKPDNRKVMSAIYIPDRNIFFVLLDWRDHTVKSPDKNLFCMDTNKKIIWYAELPKNDKSWYIVMSYHDQRLFANTLEYYVEIDSYDGHVLTEDWTK